MSERTPITGGRLEFQRQNLWVGLFVLAALAVFAVVAVIAVQERVFRREYRLNTSFPRIEGLKPGAEVYLRGFAVGRVTRISIVTMPDVRFDVEFTVEESIRLPVGTRARLSTRGFAGKALDLVTPGDLTDTGAAPPPSSGHAPLYLDAGSTLPGAAGADLDSLFSDVLLLTRRLSTTLERVDTLVAEKISPNVESVAATLNRELTSVTSDLKSTMKDTREVLDQTEGALKEDRPKAARLLDLANEDLASAGDLARRMDRAITTFETRIYPLAEDFSASLAKADTLLTRAESSIKEEDVREIMANLKSVSEKGNLLVDELRRRPWRLMRRVRGEKKDLLKELEAGRKAESEGKAPPP